METSRMIKYKALFLLVTFLLNTVVGFACSLGVDMGFNSHHHEDEGEGQQKHTHSSHADGHEKEHHHSKHTHIHSHAEEHEQVAPGWSNIVAFRSTDNDNCCKNFVIGFQNLDKQVVKKSYLVKSNNVFSYVIIPSKLVCVFVKKVRIPPKLPLGHSPPNTRIFIQSFLI